MVYHPEKISITVPRRLEKKFNYKIRYESPLLAPIKKDQLIGEFLIKKNDEVIRKHKLYADDSVETLNFSKIALNLKFLLFGESLITNQ